MTRDDHSWGNGLFHATITEDSLKSDHELYALFQSNPDFLRDALDLKVEDGYTFRSENLKELERQLDGVYQKEGCADVWLVEFHGYPPKKGSKDVYSSTIAGMSQFQMSYPHKTGQWGHCVSQSKI